MIEDDMNPIEAGSQQPVNPNTLLSRRGFNRWALLLLAGGAALGAGCKPSSVQGENPGYSTPEYAPTDEVLAEGTLIPLDLDPSLFNQPEGLVEHFVGLKAGLSARYDIAANSVSPEIKIEGSDSPYKALNIVGLKVYSEADGAEIPVDAFVFQNQDGSLETYLVVWVVDANEAGNDQVKASGLQAEIRADSRGVPTVSPKLDALGNRVLFGDMQIDGEEINVVFHGQGNKPLRVAGKARPNDGEVLPVIYQSSTGGEIVASPTPSVEANPTTSPETSLIPEGALLPDNPLLKNLSAEQIEFLKQNPTDWISEENLNTEMKAIQADQISRGRAPAFLENVLILDHGFGQFYGDPVNFVIWGIPVFKDNQLQYVIPGYSGTYAPRQYNSSNGDVLGETIKLLEYDAGKYQGVQTPLHIQNLRQDLENQGMSLPLIADVHVDTYTVANMRQPFAEILTTPFVVCDTSTNISTLTKPCVTDGDMFYIFVDKK